MMNLEFLGEIILGSFAAITTIITFINHGRKKERQSNRLKGEDHER
jgi:hypothetical protein